LFRLAWRLDDAVREHRLAFELAQQRGDPVLEAHSLFNLSEDHRYLNQLDQAEYCGGEALAGFARLSEADPRRADVLNTLGLVAHGRGQTALAIERLEAAIAGLEAQGRYVETARGLVNLGWTWAITARSNRPGPPSSGRMRCLAPPPLSLTRFACT
jgi:tetratricopeptide (TPR) repeat protein